MHTCGPRSSTLAPPGRGSLRQCLTAAVAVAMMAVAPAVASASIVYDTLASPLDWTGTRSTDNPAQTQIIGTGEYGTINNPAATISWEVTFDALSDLYTYTYEFLNWNQQNPPPPNSPNISHVIIELSADCDPAVHVLSNATLNGTSTNMTNVGTFDEHGPSIFGVKLDLGGASPLVYSFQTKRAPTWGHFFIKGGPSSAYNVGLTNTLIEDKYAFIVRPNGLGDGDDQSVVPEPASLALAGFAGLGLAFGAVRRRRRS
jgi:hypothetical protein